MRIFIFFLINTLSLNVFTQSITYTEPRQALKNNYFHYILGRDGKYFYTRTFYTFSRVYEKYEIESGAMVGMLTEINAPEDYRIYDFFYNIDGMNYICANYFKNANNYNIKAFNNNFEGRDAEILNLDISIPKNSSNSIECSFHSSASGEYLLGMVEWEEKEEKVLSLHLFKSDFSIIFSKELRYPKKEEINNILVCDDGSVFFRRSNRQDQHFICAFDQIKDYEYWEMQIVNTLVEKKLVITNFIITKNLSNELLLSGFFQPKKNEIQNLFYLSINLETRKQEINKLIELNDDFKKEYFEKEPVAIGAKRRNYSGVKYNITDNNALILLAEEHYIRKGTVGSGTANINSYTHLYKDLILFEISREGKLNYAGGINKSSSQYFTGTDKQETMPEAFPSASYKIKRIGNQLLIICPDNIFTYNFDSKKLKISEQYQLNLDNKYSGPINRMYITNDDDFSILPLRFNKADSYIYAIIHWD